MSRKIKIKELGIKMRNPNPLSPKTLTPYTLKTLIPLLKLLPLILLITSSCVTNKKYQYLQKNDVNPKSGQIKKNTILRTYEVDSFIYRLQPEDIVAINFYSSTDETLDFLSQKTMGNNLVGGGAIGQNAILLGYLIDESGNVEFPVIGNVKIAGLSVFEAQDKIQALAEQYLQTPLVEVKLLNFRFTVLGEVDGEGTHISMNNRITLLEALGLSGGLGELADKSNIKILRQNGSKMEVYYVDLLSENFIESPFFYVNQNDVIIVPPLKQRPFRMYWGENLALFTSTVTTILLIFTIVK